MWSRRRSAIERNLQIAPKFYAVQIPPKPTLWIYLMREDRRMVQW